jgi:hypothetical protein
MSHGSQFAGSEMGTSSGFHHDSTSGAVAEKTHHLHARELLAKHLSTRYVLAVQVESVFAEINPDHY